MFCKVRRAHSFALVRISAALCRSRERKELLYRAIPFALRQFRASAAQKRIPREQWYFSRNAFRDVFPASTSPPPGPSPLSTYRPTFHFSYPPTTRIRSTISSPCSTRPTSFAIPLRPFPLYYFSSFFEPLPPEHSPAFRFAVAFLPPAPTAPTPPPKLLRPRKSKLDAKTRPNVHKSRCSTYRVSGTIPGGHRFPPRLCGISAEDTLDENVWRFVRWKPGKWYKSRALLKMARV